MICVAESAQGTKCERPAGHEGCHEAFIDGDSRRWFYDYQSRAWRKDVAFGTLYGSSAPSARKRMVEWLNRATRP